MTDMEDEVEQLFATQPETSGLARHVYDAVLEMFPGAVVTVDEQNVGFGTGTGYRGLVFTVAPYRAHVTLGIAYGASLPDPAGLMTGTGKVHRHVKLRALSDVDSPALRELMRAALARASR
jgi:hypothetical protein